MHYRQDPTFEIRSDIQRKAFRVLYSCVAVDRALLTRAFYDVAYRYDRYDKREPAQRNKVIVRYQLIILIN